MDEKIKLTFHDIAICIMHEMVCMGINISFILLVALFYFKLDKFPVYLSAFIILSASRILVAVHRIAGFLMMRFRLKTYASDVTHYAKEINDIQQQVNIYLHKLLNLKSFLMSEWEKYSQHKQK